MATGYSIPETLIDDAGNALKGLLVNVTGTNGYEGTATSDAVTGVLRLGPLTVADGAQFTDYTVSVGDRSVAVPVFASDEISGGAGGGGAVDSVNGQVGVVVLSAANVGADPAGTAAGLVSTEATTRADADTALDGRLDTVEATLPGKLDSTTASATYQPLDSDLTAIAALSTTAFGRALLALADAAAGRTALGLGTAATAASGDFQPVDSDLTAIAALTTTAYGRAFLALADAAAGRAALELGTAATTATTAYDPAGSAAAAQAASQPLDSDLTSIASLTTTPYGRSFLTMLNAGAAKLALSLLKADVGLGNVDNTADTAKPVSTAQQTALDLKADKLLTENPQTGTSYTLVLSDAAKLVEMNNAAASALTVPPNSSVAFPVGTVVNIRQYGAGQVTLTPGSGVTIRSRGGALKLHSQYAEASLVKRGADEWVAAGDLAV